MPGIRALATRLVHSVKLRHQTLLDLVRPDQIVDHEPRIACETVRVTAGNVDLIEAWRGTLIRDMFRGYVADGQVGCYALVDGQLVGHLWTTVCHRGEGSRLAGGYKRLVEGEAMLRFGRLKPQFQGKAIFQKVLADSARWTFAEGVHRIIADPPVKNVPSRVAIEKTGYRRYGEGWYLQIGSKLLWSKERYDAGPTDPGRPPGR